MTRFQTSFSYSQMSAGAGIQKAKLEDFLFFFFFFLFLRTIIALCGLILTTLWVYGLMLCVPGWPGGDRWLTEMRQSVVAFCSGAFLQIGG